MSNYTSAGANKAIHINAMGQPLGEVYSELWQQLVWLGTKWGDYKALFGTSPERIDFLNKAAPAFFSSLQGILWEDILLHLARITDSPKSAGKHNLSFRQLPLLIDDSALKQMLDDLLQTALDTTEFCRDWRNRRIAHRDLMLALNQVTEPLASASRAQVHTALVCLGNTLNAISLEYLESTTFFDFAQEPGAGSANSMLYYLKAGLDAETIRRARVKSGVFDPADQQRPKIKN